MTNNDPASESYNLYSSAHRLREFSPKRFAEYDKELLKDAIKILKGIVNGK